MSKFKVGDKVRIIRNASGTKRYVGTIGRIVSDDGSDYYQYHIDSTGGDIWEDHELEPVTEPTREFIVIRRSGAETIAELRHDREVIKAAKATCAPSDTFDLDTGAKLAFDRLMGREEKTITGKSFDRIFVDYIAPAPAPKPPKFYTGKVFAAKTVTNNGDRKIENRVGRVFEFNNGVLVGDPDDYGLGHDLYKSFYDLCARAFSTEWHEVKEPSDV